MKNRLIKFQMNILMIILVIISSAIGLGGTKASAATKYISLESFADSLAVELGLNPTTGVDSNGNINVLLEKGIIKADDFILRPVYLTRTDVALMINRADEYLYGDTLDPELVELALEKRISDISKINESKRIDVVKCYLKGFIKGYSNGEYSTDREFRGSNKITKAGALDCIKLLKNKSLRAKISPDGQLIRTTKLPKYAKYYPYILASFPNEYYDWKFQYEWTTWTENGKPVELINLVDYAAPKDVDKATLHGDFASIKKERLDKWVEEAKSFLDNLLNVDYRNIDENWIDMMIDTNAAYSYNETIMRKRMEQYLKGMKKNKTIVECKSIDIDGSSLYFTGYSYYLRAHVKYRVVSSVAPLNVDIDTLIESWPHNNILFSQSMVNIRGRKIGEWMDGYYEVILDQYSDSISGSFVKFDDAAYRGKKVN